MLNQDTVKNFIKTMFYTDTLGTSVDTKMMNKLKSVANSSDKWVSTTVTTKNIDAISKYDTKLDSIKIGDTILKCNNALNVVKPIGNGSTITVNVKSGSLVGISRKSATKTDFNTLLVL